MRTPGPDELTLGLDKLYFKLFLSKSDFFHEMMCGWIIQSTEVILGAGRPLVYRSRVLT